MTPLRQTIAILAAVTFGAILFCGIFASASLAQQSKATTDRDGERQRIEQIIREYLLENPELMVEVMQRLNAKQQAAQAHVFSQNLELVKDLLFGNESAPVIGNPNGKTVIVKFSDYNCPYCKRMVPVVEKAVARNGDLKVILRVFPILGPVSRYAAAAALAANLQDSRKYGQVHKRLFGARARLTNATIDEILGKMGIDMERLKTDMKSPKIDAAIELSLELGQRIGINGTPAFIGAGRLMPGPVIV